MRTLMRLWCSVVGHSWTPPYPVSASSASRSLIIYRSECDRCDRIVLGDWDYLERLHVWSHDRGLGA